MVYAKLRSDALILTPQNPTEVPNGAFFMDITNSDAFTTKTTGGSTQPVTSTTQDLLTKIKRNMMGVTIPVNTSVALLPDGTITIADADASGTRYIIGITQEQIANEAFGRILLIGPNAKDVLLGLGFNPGDSIYMGKTPGSYTNDIEDFDSENDTIVRVGFADCSAGIATSEAKDLIMFSEILSV